MTLKEFSKMLDGREYGHEITKEEEALAKELGFVVVFGYSDDNAELRGAIYDEIGCFDGGILEHDDLPEMIYAMWCPEYVDCAWAYQTSIPNEKFHIYDRGELYCVGIVCDINKPKQTNADRIRAMSDEELAEFLGSLSYGRETPWSEPFTEQCCKKCPTVKVTVVEYRKEMELNECDFVDGKCPHDDEVLWWLKQPGVKDKDHVGEKR